MKIITFSDLHVDVRSFNVCLKNLNDVIVILPGDVCSLHNPLFEYTIRNICEQVKYLLFVPGNHEYYYCDIIFDKKILTDLADKISNFILLDNKTTIIDNINFIGSTMWTNMNNNNWFSIHACKSGMNDFRIIRNNGLILTPEDTVEIYNTSVKFIEEELLTSQYDYSIQTNVVITHHAPSYASIIPKYLGDAINAAFASDLNELILNHNIKYWIHGHMHAKLDYMIGDTRIICNPRGYNNRENPTFNSKMELEL